MGYDSSLGKFVQRDPIVYADGMNVYQYEQGRPTSLLDPYGTEATSQPSTQPSYTLPGSLSGLTSDPDSILDLSSPTWDITWSDDPRWGWSQMDRDKERKMRAMTGISAKLRGKPCLTGCILAGESKHVENYDRVLKAWRTRRGNTTHPKWNDMNKLYDEKIRPWSEIDAATEAINCLRAALETKKISDKCGCTESKEEIEDMIKGLENFRSDFEKQVKGKQRPPILNTKIP